MFESLEVHFNRIFIVLLCRVQLAQLQVRLIIGLDFIGPFEADDGLFVDSQIFIAEALE